MWIGIYNEEIVERIREIFMRDLKFIKLFTVELVFSPPFAFIVDILSFNDVYY